jgi:hypothetical protein
VWRQWSGALIRRLSFWGLVYCLSRSVPRVLERLCFIRRLRKRDSMEQSCFRIILSPSARDEIAKGASTGIDVNDLVQLLPEVDTVPVHLLAKC